jgi:lipopolysaccharide transport system ATP-binding protein
MSESPANAGRVIRLDRVSKIYRLYQKPGYRLLDLFGLCPANAGFYSEHRALTDVALDVMRGQKVAIIGRNGAGKSTLLKLITGLVQPSDGRVEVHGRISNLLQIGSGFHPDFTGRQNVFASMAHQGIVGRAAADRFDEIVEFSEIEEYIDQPMKTYSTGMCSRLMFSASIVLKPELLIVDEILGVGDAYFAHKSFERMRQLCSDEGTTLLLVTHDIYGAQNLCDRFIWIDRGKVKYDGEAGTAVAMYETSVKEQEEEARRRRTIKTVTAGADNLAPTLTVVVRSRTGFALQRPLALALIDLDAGVERLDLALPEPSSWHPAADGNLGPIETRDRRTCRVLQTFGSIYHKAEWIVTVPAAARHALARARVQWYYDGSDEAEFVVLGPGRELLIRGSLGGGPEWQEAIFERDDGAELREPVQTEYGSAVVRITDTQFLDASGSPVMSVRHGDPLTVRIAIDVNDPAMRDVSFVLAFTRHGTAFAVNVVDHRLTLPPGPNAVVDVKLPAVRLGSGQWFLRVGIGEADMFRHGTLGYFAVSDRWYHLMREGIPVEVQSRDQLDSAGCFMVHEGVFSVRGAGRAGTSGFQSSTEIVR